MSEHSHVEDASAVRASPVAAAVAPVAGADLDRAAAAGAQKVVFLVTEDWFFCSHFLPMARAAVAAGFEVVVVARERSHRAAIETAGARLVALEAERKSLSPVEVWRAFSRLKALIAAERPDIVHAIALRMILLGGLAARLAGVRRRVYALTGLGFLGAARRLPARAARAAIRALMRGPLDGPGVRFLFENPHDARALRLDPADRTKVRLVGGAGIDPDALRPSPLPAGPPLKVALVARMLWSKGVDLAVEAVRRARVAGADVSLDIFGAPDPSNPKAFTQDRLEAWSREEGISWRGPTRDIAGVWAEHHVGCLPSRGGEGLPRTLLETAACGRAMLTTAVPGCGDFVRDGIEGLVVPPDDAPALAEALVRLAADPALVARMGEAARARVLDGYTEAQVGAAVVGLYRDMLADGR